MFKLLKYEWLRRRKLLSVVFISFLFAEAVTIFGMIKGEGWILLSIFLMFAMFFVAMLLPLVDAVATYYSDFKKTHGYMLFLTPNNGFKIVGSKALFAFIELILTLVLVSGLFFANYHVSKISDPTIANGFDFLVSGISEAFAGSSSGLSPLVLLTTAGILEYFTTIMLAMTALTIGRTLLSGKSYNWLVALAMYIGLSVGIQFINIVILSAFGFIKDVLTIASTTQAIYFLKYMILGLGLSVLWIAASYITSSLILNKRIDL